MRFGKNIFTGYQGLTRWALATDAGWKLHADKLAVPFDTDFSGGRRHGPVAFRCKPAGGRNLDRGESRRCRNDAEDMVAEPTRGAGAPRVAEACETMRAAEHGIVGCEAIDPLRAEAFPECGGPQAQHASPAAVEQGAGLVPAAHRSHALEHEMAVERRVGNRADRIAIDAFCERLALVQIADGASQQSLGAIVQSKLVNIGSVQLIDCGDQFLRRMSHGCTSFDSGKGIQQRKHLASSPPRKIVVVAQIAGRRVLHKAAQAIVVAAKRGITEKILAVQNRDCTLKLGRHQRKLPLPKKPVSGAEYVIAKQANPIKRVGLDAVVVVLHPCRVEADEIEIAKGRERHGLADEGIAGP